MEGDRGELSLTRKPETQGRGSLAARAEGDRLQNPNPRNGNETAGTWALGTRTVTATPSRIHQHINSGRKPNGEEGDQDHPSASGAWGPTDPKGTSHSRSRHPDTEPQCSRGEHSTRSGHENRIRGTTQHEHLSTLLPMRPCVNQETKYPRKSRNM